MLSTTAARQVTVRLPVEILDDVDGLAEELGVGRSDIIREGCQLVVDPCRLAARAALMVASAGRERASA
jgi:metal-responsive CopG/Arc/MetJ family transcriptional regulator